MAIHLELAKHQGTKEYRDCVDALCSLSVMRDRLDTLVGTTFGASRVELDSLPDRLV